VRDDFEPRRLKLQREAEERGWIKPTAAYGYFPVQSQGQDLIVYESTAFTPGSLTPRGKVEEIIRFNFPRQAEREGLCLSDYFQPVESSRFDVLALQVVTVGPYVDELRWRSTRGANMPTRCSCTDWACRPQRPRRVAPPGHP
jgi:5-methyltetrahydrofolate--homocysteine methyltransferase